MCKLLALAVFCCLLPCATSAQTFSSGSTGADGALDLSTMTCPNNICEIQLPESGVFNFTTVNVPTNKALIFKRNSRNTPVIMLAQGNVVIAGTVDVSANGRVPGPGGFYGGYAVSGQPGQRTGFGPGGGTSVQNPHGSWVGPLTLAPAVGGSGGYGGGCSPGGCSDNGGGGGGAITIASSTTITVTTTPTAYQGISASGSVGDTFNGRGSFGSGGAIRLVANSLNVTSSGALFACNVFQNPNFPPGPCGVVRLEALQGQLNFNGTSVPAAHIVPFTSNAVPVIVTNSLPKLTITSVGGYSVPSYAGLRFDTVDLLLPNQIPDPVNVIVQANNIPVSSQVTVGFVSGSPNATSAPCTLAGTFENSSCTAQISSLNRTGVTYLLATVIFAPPGLATQNPPGPNHVAQVRLEIVLGGKPKYVFLRQDGTAIDTAKLSKTFLQQFGL